MAIASRQLGDWGESLACQFLKRNGYKILQRNYRAMRGEIDIIAKERQTVVFVEVKSAARTEGVAPELRINKAKQQQLYRIANLYIATHQHSDETEYRMDVIIVTGNAENHVIRHYQNAFYLL